MSENPYAPSQVDDVAEAPRPHGWELAEGVLLAEEGAVFPMVDPYTGESEERMTMMRLAVYRRVLWPRWLFAGGLALTIMAAYSGVPDYGAIGLLAALVGFIAGIAVPIFNRRLWLTMFVTRRTLSRQRTVDWMIRGMVMLLLIFFFAPAVFRFAGDWIVVAVAFLILAILIAARWGRRRIYHRGRRGERFAIGGLHPRAMEALGVSRKISPAGA